MDDVLERSSWGLILAHSFDAVAVIAVLLLVAAVVVLIRASWAKQQAAMGQVLLDGMSCKASEVRADFVFAERGDTISEADLRRASEVRARFEASR